VTPSRAWVATKRLGCGGTSCAAPGYDRVVLDWPASLPSRNPPVADLKRARGAARAKTSLVVAATAKNGRASGRLRLNRVTAVAAARLMDGIPVAVEPGATMHTDGWKGDAGLAAAGDQQRCPVRRSGADQAHDVMPRVHRVAALHTRWLLETLQGGVHPSRALTPSLK